MIEVKLHDIGEGMTEGEIIQYYVKIGDRVKADQPLVEIQTDKMTAEIPSPKDGVITEILVEPGAIVSVGTTLIRIETELSKDLHTNKGKPNLLHMVQMPFLEESKKQLNNGKGSNVALEKKNQQPARDLVTGERNQHLPLNIGLKEKNQQSARDLDNGEREHQATVNKPVEKRKHQPILAAPYTRKIAREHGVDLSFISGSGPAGRITDGDVYQYIKMKNENLNRLEKKELNTTISSSQLLQEVQTNADQVQRSGELNSEKQSEKEILPFRGRRRQIAKKMVQSFYTIPHITHFDEVDMTELKKLCEQFKRDGHHISVVAFFIKAVQITLKDFPIFNAKLDEEKMQIIIEKAYHIGIAVDTEEGLIVPVIHHVEQKSIKQIHAEMKELTRKAKENQLVRENLIGGTFTISNVGPFGSIGATPIINYPEVALLAFHRTKEMPVVYNGEITIRSMMNISMSFDHRVIDGMTAVLFTNRFKQLIENPTMLLLEMN